jgi:hypothetical protein
MGFIYSVRLAALSVHDSRLRVSVVPTASMVGLGRVDP